MKRYFCIFASVAATILLYLPVIAAAKENKVTAKEQAEINRNSPLPRPDSMTLWQARRTVVADLTLPGKSSLNADPSSFRFTLDSFEFDASPRRGKMEHFKVDLKVLEAVVTKYGAMSSITRLKDESGKDLPVPLNLVERRPRYNTDQSAAIAMRALAAALNRLREFAGTTGEPLRTFTQQAATWRALQPKPPIPEDVRKQRLLAENAVKEQKPEIALSHYEAGLQAYPTWPQGWFNAALTAGELGFYGEAIEHMQAYLELVPDAPDVQAAQDQIVIWQDKSGGHEPETRPEKPGKK